MPSPAGSSIAVAAMALLAGLEPIAVAADSAPLAAPGYKLHAFTGDEGSNPDASVVQAADGKGQLMSASDGTFYGTTQQGGTQDAGALYRMTAAGVVTVIVNFAIGFTDGQWPLAPPAQGADGLLYGTTYVGGLHGCGIVYRVGLTGTGFTVVHDFGCGAGAQPPNTDGGQPEQQLLLASDGNLYGVTSAGGESTGRLGGTVFSISGTGSYAVVHSFGMTDTDAAVPYAPLTQAANGALVGTTALGGGGIGNGNGTVFRLALP